MFSRGTNIKFLLGVSISLFLTVSAHQTEAQVDAGKVEVPILSTNKVIREEGWPIPKIRSKPIGKPSSKMVDGVKVVFENLIPSTSIVDYEDFFVFSDKELRIAYSKRQIVAMSASKVKSRVFAYAIRYSPYHGHGTNVGGVYDVYFVDNDGNGSFETRINSTKPSLPEWVKKL